MNLDNTVGTLKSILDAQLTNADQYGDRDRIEALREGRVS